MVGNQPDAEDLTTEVFLRVLKPLRVTAKIAEVRGYLRATMRTVLLLNEPIWCSQRCPKTTG